MYAYILAPPGLMRITIDLLCLCAWSRS